MNVLGWIVFGLVVGTLARFFMPGDDPAGCIVTVILGVAGAVVGGFIGSQFGMGRVTGFNVESLVLSVIGAMVLLVMYRLIRED